MVLLAVRRCQNSQFNPNWKIRGPFKQVASHFGGTRQGMAISRPRRARIPTPPASERLSPTKISSHFGKTPTPIFLSYSQRKPSTRSCNNDVEFTLLLTRDAELSLATRQGCFQNGLSPLEKMPHAKLHSETINLSYKENNMQSAIEKPLYC
jgi:hypothetical protein